MEQSLSGSSQLHGGTPCLSVVINNYNYAEYLPKALDSALAQLGPGDEIVLVDDGSRDESRVILDRYRGRSDLRIFEQANQGQVAAVFNGLAESRGDLCLLLDSDDWFLPGYLERVRQLSVANPEVALFFSAPVLGGSSEEAVAITRAIFEAMALPEGETGVSRWGTWIGEFVGTPTSGLAVRRSLVDRFLAVSDQLPDHWPVDDRLLPWLGTSHERHASLRLSADGIIVRGSSILGVRKYYCSEPGFFYRIHGGNAFATLSPMARKYLNVHRGRQICRITAAAFDVPTHPAVQDVVAEVRQRSRPLHWRRRLRLTLSYQIVVLRAKGSWRQRIVGQWVVLRHFLLAV